MGFTEILTLILITLKLTHNIDWAWPLVLLPEIIGVGLYVLFFILTVVIGVGFAARSTRR